MNPIDRFRPKPSPREQAAQELYTKALNTINNDPSLQRNPGSLIDTVTTGLEQGSITIFGVPHDQLPTDPPQIYIEQQTPRLRKVYELSHKKKDDSEGFTINKLTSDGSSPVEPSSREIKSLRDLFK